VLLLLLLLLMLLQEDTFNSHPSLLLSSPLLALLLPAATMLPVLQALLPGLLTYCRRPRRGMYTPAGPALQAFTSS
jgi:hypothetical protein